MPTKLQATNYVKLSVRHATPLDDSESVARPALDVSGEPRSRRLDPDRKYVTTWIWTFSDRSKLEAVEALGLAQSKRSKLRELHKGIAPAAFQMATLGPSCLRGVREIGESVREPLEALESDVDNGGDDGLAISFGGVRSPGLAVVGEAS